MHSEGLADQAIGHCALQKLMKNLGKLSEKMLRIAMREVRLASYLRPMLNYTVATKGLYKQSTERAVVVSRHG